MPAPEPVCIQEPDEKQVLDGILLQELLERRLVVVVQPPDRHGPSIVQEVRV